MPIDTTLERESQYWGTVTRLLLDSGAVPYDVDRRRATMIRDREALLKLGSRRADPQVEEHWRGRFVDETLALLEGMGAKRVLELGCGAGWLALEMARRGVEVHAIDLSEERIEVARSYYAERAKHEELAPVRYEVGNLEVITPAVGEYDAIVSFTTLHHIRDKRALIERCSEALLDGGIFVVCDVDRHAGPWPWRAFRGLTIFGLSLLLLPLPSLLPRRRRLLEGVYYFAEGVLTQRMLQRLRSLASSVLWSRDDSDVLAGGSPLEGTQDHDDASAEELLASIFDEVQVEHGELFGLLHLMVLELPAPLKAALTRFLYTVDQASVGFSWGRGTLMYSVATKVLAGSRDGAP